jgi:hypothetical protein
MNIIGKFVSKIRRKLFARRVEGEIYQKIFPHLNGAANHGYPFASTEEMEHHMVRGCLHARLNLQIIDRTAAQLPKAEGEAFRYIAYRDLNERMEMYLALAEERTRPETCDTRLVATRAA